MIKIFFFESLRNCC